MTNEISLLFLPLPDGFTTPVCQRCKRMPFPAWPTFPGCEWQFVHVDENIFAMFSVTDFDSLVFSQLLCQGKPKNPNWWAGSKLASFFLVYRPSRWYPLCLVSPLAPNHTWKLQNIPSAGMSKPRFDHSRVWTPRWYSSVAFMGVWVDFKLSSMSLSPCVEVKYTPVPQSVSLQVKREGTAS